MNFAIPLQRLIDTPYVLAFYHPDPAYQLHILLLPKRKISSFSALTAQDDRQVLELMNAARVLVNRYNLDKATTV